MLSIAFVPAILGQFPELDIACACVNFRGLNQKPQNRSQQRDAALNSPRNPAIPSIACLDV